jgi:hypothetical protein
VRRAFRYVNVAVALVTLASALAVLVSDVRDPGYRAYYRDAVWFVTAYCAIQLVMLVEFARDGRLVPWLALAKAVAAWLFLANIFALWPYWRTWTPARYVYQLFEWGGGSTIGIMALVVLGRGAFNTLNAFYFTAPWWRELRVRAPLVGRIVTALPVAAIFLCLWAFRELVTQEVATFSADASEVARMVWDGVDCDAVRAHAGKTTSDVRQRGDRRYQVMIAYGCDVTRVVVQGDDGRIGTAAGPRRDCCPTSG